MAKNFEVLIFIFLASVLITVRAMETSNDASVDLEKVSANYIKKAERAEQLRGEMHEQFNLLGHVTTLPEYGVLVSALLGHIRRTYLELDEILDAFVPSQQDAHKIIGNFKAMSESAGGSSSQFSESSGELSKKPKRFSPKRNMVASMYNKVPMIRTGK